jgi:hypothetical protein
MTKNSAAERTAATDYTLSSGSSKHHQTAPDFSIKKKKSQKPSPTPRIPPATQS